MPGAVASLGSHGFLRFGEGGNNGCEADRQTEEKDNC